MRPTLILAGSVLLVLSGCFAARPASTPVEEPTPPATPAGPLPIMFVHGKPVHSPGRSPSASYDAWAHARAAWWTWGLPEHVAWAYYADDPKEYADVHAHPEAEADHGHSRHHGGPGAHVHQGRHGADTPIEHLAYHWAWAIHDRYASQGRCVDVVAHSMGGIVVRYAVGAYQKRADVAFADFPPSLCVRHAVTLGSPHGGTEFVRICTNPAYSDAQCRAMATNSPFMRMLADTPEFRRPQADGGTRWLVLGSDAEDVVIPSSSAFAMDFDRAIVHEARDLVLHSRSTTDAAGTKWYLSIADASTTANVRTAERGASSWQTSSSAEWGPRQIWRFLTSEPT